MDSFIVGGLVLAAGVVLGAALAVMLTLHFEKERDVLHQIIGRYQQAMDEHVPEEEM